MNDIVTDDSEKASSERCFLLDYLEYADSEHLKNGGNDVYNIPHCFISHTACTFNYISTAKLATFCGIHHSVTVQVFSYVAPAVASQALSGRHPPTNAPPPALLPSASRHTQFSNPTSDRHVLPRNTLVPCGTRFASAHSLTAPPAAHSASNWPVSNPFEREREHITHMPAVTSESARCSPRFSLEPFKLLSSAPLPASHTLRCCSLATSWWPLT